MEGERLINDVTFGTTYCEDLGLYLASKELGNPKPKISLVEVPGSSVTLDFTEAFGSVNYSNRTIQLVLLCLEPWDDQFNLQSEVRSLLHGQKMNIYFDEDDGMYYRGRIAVNSWSFYQGAGRVQISINAEPFLYKPCSLTSPALSSTAQDVVINNKGLKPVVPTLDLTGATTVAFGSTSVEVTSGTGKTVTGLVFDPGENTVSLASTGTTNTVTFHWTEAYL